MFAQQLNSTNRLNLFYNGTYNPTTNSQVTEKSNVIFCCCQMKIPVNKVTLDRPIKSEILIPEESPFFSTVTFQTKQMGSKI